MHGELTASEKPSREDTQPWDAGGGKNKPWSHLQSLGERLVERATCEEAVSRARKMV